MTEQNYEVLRDGGAPIKMWTRGVPVEDKAKSQLFNTSRLPFIHKHVAVMPDVHLGIGATVGSVIPTKGAIIPAAVGVDIGCGMMAVRTNLTANDLPDSLSAVRAAIENYIPLGMQGWDSKGGRGYVPEDALKAWQVSGLSRDFLYLCEQHPHLEKSNHLNHMGSLGTGNHFIEVCLDESGVVWIMLHSGSRGIGNAIGRHFIELAKNDMRSWFINLPDEDLAYIPEGSQHFNEYVGAVEWAQRFAYQNRQVMMVRALNAIERTLGIAVYPQETAVNCHHNYISKENHFGANVWVTRKGAVRARAGDLGIIPGSMGARSYIVRGKGNPESFHSCSHGAGRVMSRGEAKRRFRVEDQEEQTRGIECRKDAGVIDEIPAAYKNIDAVMEAQADLVEIVHTLKQVVCVKG